MKKLIALLLSLLMLFTLAACGSSDTPEEPEDPKPAEEEEEEDEKKDDDEDEDGSSILDLLDLPGDLVYPNDGVAEGELESVMRTYFFDFSVSDVSCDYAYDDYTAAWGYKLVLVELTVENTFGDEIPMFPTDFSLQWDDGDGQVYPVHAITGSEMLNGFYDLEKRESRSGLLIFEVPEREDRFTLRHQEYFDDDTLGDEFYVFFEAEVDEDLEYPESYGSVYTAEDGYGYGEMGSVLRTTFFDFCLNDAYVTDSFAGYEAAEGAKLLVAELTVSNNDYEEVPMYDLDFQIQWGDSSEDAFAFPLTGLEDEDVFPDEYELEAGEKRTGILVFEVPADADETAFSISHQEYFSGHTEGDTYFIYFSTADTPAPLTTEEEPADL